MTEPLVWTSVDLLLAVGGMLAVLAFEILAFRLRGTEDSFVVSQVRALFWLHAKFFFGLRVVCDAGDPVPPQGGVILVANHQSGADPVLLSVSTRRQIRFLMAREYYETKGLRWLFRSVHTIPVKRDGLDLSATKASLKALHEGDCLGIFPQGGIREADLDFEDSKSGAALLALKTGASVVPCYISGSPEHDSVFRVFFMPSRVQIHFGRPFEVGEGGAQRKPTRAQIDAAAEQVLAAIVELRPATEESGVAAG